MVTSRDRTTLVVGTQCDLDHVVGIAPIWVVILCLGKGCNLAHKCPRLGKGRKLKPPIQAVWSLLPLVHRSLLCQSD